MQGINLEAKGYINKYLSDCMKLLSLSECLEDAEEGTEALSTFIDSWLALDHAGSLHMLSDLNLIGNVTLNGVSIHYINVSVVEDPVSQRPCSKLFKSFEDDGNYAIIMKLFEEDRDLMEIFNDLPSPTFAMIATYRVLYDALYYEKLQKSGASNKVLFTYLSETSWVSAYTNYLECMAQVYNSVNEMR